MHEHCSLSFHYTDGKRLAIRQTNRCILVISNEDYLTEQFAQ